MATKKTGRKYGKAASKSVRSALKRRKRGTLKSGPGGQGGKVKSREQAIAIGLSEAREKGAKVPPKRGAKKASRKSGARKTARKSATKKTGRRSAAKKSASRKGGRKTASRMSSARKRSGARKRPR